MNAQLKYVVVLLLAMLMAEGVVAQHSDDVDVYDYRHYKFYDEPEEDDLTMASYLGVDSLAEEEKRDAGLYIPNVSYSRSFVNYQSRGLGRDEEVAMLGCLQIDYTTMRLLTSLGYRRDVWSGLSHAYRAGGVAGATLLTPISKSGAYAGHSLRVDFSGRNYLGGVSYRGVYEPKYHGVVLDDGWTISSYVRLRTGRDIYVDGVYRNSVDVALGASYGDRRNRFDVALLLPWVERGLRQASTHEAFSLTGDVMYNPSWGVQNGKMRNARVAKSLRPEVVAMWQHRLTVVTELCASLNLYVDRRGKSSLAWYNAPTPMADNYKYMPSYYSSDDDCRGVERMWRDNNLKYTQIDWSGLYHTNALQSDGSARYAVEDRRVNELCTTIDVGLRSKLSAVVLEYGLELGCYSGREFKVVDDLLGAKHILDVDYYIVDDATYSDDSDNNLRSPNRKVVEGDRYGYDYRLTHYDAMVYGMAHWSVEEHLFDVGARFGLESVKRRGYYEKELFPGGGSYGTSRVVNLCPYMLSASWQLPVGQHTIGASLLLRGASPEADDMFLQPQYNNRCVDDIGLVTMTSAEVAYGYCSQPFSVDARIFVAREFNARDVVRYYDDLAGAYVDAVVDGISRISFGLETDARVVWSRMFSSNVSLSVAQYRYVGDACVSLYADNDNDLLAISTAEMRGCHLSAPEVSLYGDLNFSYRGWRAQLAAQWWALRYVTPSVVRRAGRVVDYAASGEERQRLMSQERLPDAFTLDVALSKRVSLGENVTLNVQLGVRNLLGSKIIYSGYEPSRIHLRTIAGRADVAPFANRYTYAYPRTFSIAASLWF
jgi:hypothetical protein